MVGARDGCGYGSSPQARARLNSLCKPIAGSGAGARGAVGGDTARLMELNGVLLVKLHDQTHGDYHRVHCIPAEGWEALRTALQGKLDASSAAATTSSSPSPSRRNAPAQLRAILYEDDDGDQAAISSDESLSEAAAHVWRSGRDRVLVTPVMGAAQLLSPSGKTAIAFGTQRSSAARRSIALGAQGGKYAHWAGTAAAAAVTTAGQSMQTVEEDEGRTTLQRKSLSPHRTAVRPDQNMSAVSSFLGGLIAASSVALGAGIVLAAKAAKR